jgi:hypothetical protein
MSEPEIETILGGPAGDYRMRKGVSYECLNHILAPDRLELTTRKEWNTNAYSIRVYFGPDGKAVRIEGMPAESHSLIERIPLLRTLRDFIPIP